MMRFHRNRNENHEFIHGILHEEIHKNKKKYHKFSKKIFLSLGFSTITILLVSNIIIGGIFSSYRYYHQKKLVKQISKEIQKIVNENDINKSEKYLKMLIYENTYVKISDINSGEIYFDSYSDYLELANQNTSKFSLIKLEVETKESPLYKISILKNIQNEKGFILQFAIIMMFVNLLSIFVVFFISKMLTFKILFPINQIIDTAEKISSENLSQRVKTFPVNDELTRLGSVINNMIDRLEKAFILQKKFVSDVSHELRTPLQIIKGYTDFILDKGIKDETMLKELLSFIKEEVDNMIKLTEKLLFLAKSEKNRGKLELSEVKFYDLCQKIKTDLLLTNPEINLKLEGDIDDLVVLDKKLILQGLRAIIDNAIKYSKENKDIEIRYFKDENNFRIEIEDYGIGIDKNELENVFERFYRVDESRSKEIKGSGLGLAIVKNIINLHKGKIKMESNLGEGTNVIITIPLNL